MMFVIRAENLRFKSVISTYQKEKTKSQELYSNHCTPLTYYQHPHRSMYMHTYRQIDGCTKAKVIYCLNGLQNFPGAYCVIYFCWSLLQFLVYFEIIIGLQRRCQNGCKSQGYREFALTVCLLAISEAASIKSHQHDCVNMN